MARSKKVLEKEILLNDFENEKEKEKITGNKPSRKGANSETETSFFNVDHIDLDIELTPQQQKEWNAIYASYRSRTPLSGTVTGIERYKIAVNNIETQKIEQKEIVCLVIFDYQVKVIIPESEIWYDDTDKPVYVTEQMIGAKINYVITNIDRLAECAVASRKMALSYSRSHFYKDRSKNENGKILQCNILVVGPKRMIVECNGFDIPLKAKDISYSAIIDLRKEYRPGGTITAKLLAADKKDTSIEISIKAATPNPFFNAERKHPVSSLRHGVISGTYAGGVFCSLSDGTTCHCLYSPGYFNEEFFIGDEVRIVITSYNYEKQMIYGKILSRFNK